ncbi:MAG TPA: hypothetical protein VHI78_04930 [Bacteroidales bacterium]|nr:hypothetical protein [Bacteroidales bacterium]
MALDYFITDYCKIRNKTISRNDNIIFPGTEEKPVSFFAEAYKHFGISYPKFYKMDSLCKLGFLASEILMQGKDRNFKGEDFGIVLYNAASSIDSDCAHQQSIKDRSSYFPSPSVFVYTLPNIVIGEICIRHKLFGESAFFIAENFDTQAIYDYIRLLFDEKVVQNCFTGWIECDANHYDCCLFMVEKSEPEKGGFAIFDAENIKEIYSR